MTSRLVPLELKGSPKGNHVSIYWGCQVVITPLTQRKKKGEERETTKRTKTTDFVSFFRWRELQKGGQQQQRKKKKKKGEEGRGKKNWEKIKRSEESPNNWSAGKEERSEWRDDHHVHVQDCGAGGRRRRQERPRHTVHSGTAPPPKERKGLVSIYFWATQPKHLFKTVFVKLNVFTLFIFVILIKNGWIKKVIKLNETNKANSFSFLFFSAAFFREEIWYVSQPLVSFCFPRNMKVFHYYLFIIRPHDREQLFENGQPRWCSQRAGITSLMAVALPPLAQS